jgi:hypothetical protein
VRVVDLSRVLAAPFAAALLGDLGADVVKVEDPAGGDEARTGRRSGRANHLPTSSQHATTRAIAVDLKHTARVASRQAARLRRGRPGGDFRTGAMEEFGSATKRSASSNPRLVYCSVSAFGVPVLVLGGGRQRSRGARPSRRVQCRTPSSPGAASPCAADLVFSSICTRRRAIRPARSACSPPQPRESRTGEGQRVDGLATLETARRPSPTTHAGVVPADARGARARFGSRASNPRSPPLRNRI